MKFLVTIGGIIITFFLGCTSIPPGQRLEETNPILHKQLTGSLYLLSESEFGETIYSLYLAFDGTIHGDTILFGDSSGKYWWVGNLEKYTGNPSLISLSPEEITIYRDRDMRGGDPITIGKFYLQKGAHISFNNYPDHLNNLPDTSIYKDLTPPLGVLTFVTGGPFTGNKLKVQTFAYTRNEQDIYAAQEAQSIKPLKVEKEKLDKINKKSVRAIITFIGNTKDEKNIEEAKGFLLPLLDTKVKAYLHKHHRSIYPYINSTICHKNGEEVYPFYELFRRPVLGINPNSGVKTEFLIEKIDKDIIITITDNLNMSYNLTLRPYKGRLTLLDFKLNYKTPYPYHDLVEFFKRMREYPSYNCIDSDLIEKL